MLDKRLDALVVCLLLLGFTPRLLAQIWNHDPTDGDHGPGVWHELDESFATCLEGRQQSPIDITGAQRSGMPALVFHYRPTPLVVENNGHTIEVPYELGSWLRVGGETYRLVQFHFHTPSEHTLAGQELDMEVHFVHLSSSGQLAVVGVLMRSGRANSALTSILANAPHEEGENEVEHEFTSAVDLLPHHRGYFTYPGSLTTPPCSEGVRWFVLRQTIEVSDSQIEALRELVSEFEGYDGYPFNNRPVQPLNGRNIKTHPGGLR